MKVGSAFATIPLPSGILLGGFSARRTWSGKTDLPLEINVVALLESDHQVTIVVSIDALYANELSQRLKRYESGLGGKIVCVASHTHFAPSLSPAFTALGSCDDVYMQSIVQQAIGLIRIAIRDASSDCADAWVSEIGRANGLASKRRSAGLEISKQFPFARMGCVMSPPKGQPEAFPIEAFVVGSKEKQVVFWSFACHPSTHYDYLMASPEFPGYVRRRLREQFGSDLTVVFLLGACGDVRQPFFTRNPIKLGWRPALLGLAAGGKRSFYRPEQHEWLTWCEGIVDSAVKAVSASLAQARNRALFSFSSLSISNADFFDGSPPVRELEIQALGFSQNIQLITVNAELTSDFARAIQSKLDADHHYLIATCANECMGYLATAAEVEQGGYEGRRWISAFGCDARVKKSAESAVVAAARSVTTARAVAPAAIATPAIVS